MSDIFHPSAGIKKYLPIRLSPTFKSDNLVPSMTLSFFLLRRINGKAIADATPTIAVGINVHSKILRFLLALAFLSNGHIFISIFLNI
jgi:hypothetical protein